MDRTHRSSRTRSTALLALVVTLLPDGLLALQRTPSNPALGARISELVHTMLTGDNAQEAAARDEAWAIFRSQGLPTIGEVGDEAAYSFIVLMCSTAQADLRALVLSKAKETSARGALAADAVSYCEARIRLDAARTAAMARTPSHPELRDQIQRLVTEDQAVRQRADFDSAKMQRVDREHEAVVSSIFERYGMPTYAMVGPEAASNFVTLVQHQPPELRRRVLPRLKAAVDAEQADPKDYANVYDRTERDAGRAQLYGQNLECSRENPTLHRAPIEQEAEVNVRRASIGLLRLEMYERLVIEMSPAMCGSAAPRRSRPRGPTAAPG